MKSKSFKSITGISLAALAALASNALSPSVAFALDGKIYPGSNCVRYAGSSSVIYNFSAIGNNSTTQALFLDCPGVKDATSIHHGWVRGQDRHDTQNIRCQLFSVYRNAAGGFVGWWSPVGQSVGSVVAVQQWNYGAVNGNGSSHYYYSCQIPPKVGANASWIDTYSITEN